MSSEANAALGAEALELLRRRETGSVPDGLFDQIEAQLADVPERSASGRRFWLGTGFGGAVAASLFALALTIGWIEMPKATDGSENAEFVVTLNEPRMMDIAIEAERALQGASISILLSGGVEVDGYQGQRELTWTSDLDVGVNRLTLPVVAINRSGGQVIVRLSHPDSEQVFVVDLKTDV